MATRRWKANPGKRATPKNPEVKVWLRFRKIDPGTGQGLISREKVRAGNYVWLHRGWEFDIMEATEDD